MEIMPVIGVGMIAAMISILLRQYRPEYAMLVSLAAGVAILLLAVEQLGPVVEQLKVMMNSVSLSYEYIEILLKALGICYLTQVACDCCKDAGESAIASKMEIAGKVAVLLISLPLFTQVLSIVRNLMT